MINRGKKNIILLFLIILIILLIYLPFSSAGLFKKDSSNDFSGTGGGEFGGGGASGSWESTDDLTNLDGNGQELVDKLDSRNYAWDQLKERLLNNPVISGINNFLARISVVFLVLIGEEYSFSFSFFFVVVFFICFFIWFNRIFKIVSIFSDWVSLILSFGLAIGLGQLGLYNVLSNLCVSLIFGERKWWVNLLILVAVIFGLVFFSKIFKSISLLSKKGKEKLAKEKEKLDRKVLHTQVDELGKAIN